MRLFIAINFSEEVKNKILDIINKFKEDTLSGRFVSREHMHLTIEFLGEIKENDIEKIKAAMDNISVPPTSLRLDRIDSFKGRNGDIYWIGIEENREVLDIKSQIYNMLKDDFKLDKRKFTPHLTIGRNVKINKYSNPNIFLEDKDRISIPVYQIDLMKSEQINGILTYTNIYSKYL